MVMAIASRFLVLSLIMSIATSSDQSSLVALRDHLIPTNPNNFVTQNWSKTSSVCNWIGVSCGSGQQRVIALEISGMEVRGTIPSMLGNLSFLSSLDLSNNDFYGRLPDDLSRLPRLRVVNLHNNSFSGVIPSSFFNISELQSLIISDNQLHGNVPQQIGNLSNLKEFYGGVNRFTGALPASIGNLRMLEFLYLGNNMLEGSIPVEISNLHSLQEIGLNNNSLSGSIPHGIFNISSLRSISMINNSLSGTLPSTMGRSLPNLEYLFLYKNSITGKIPDSISNSSKLKQITLQHNKLTGPIPNSLGNLKDLDCLHLYDNDLTNDAPGRELSFLTSLTNCPKLQYLVVSNNPLRGFLPPNVGNLSSSLISIYVSNCMITGEIPRGIGNLSSLNNLDIAGNDISGFVPTTVSGLRRLQGLFLSQNMLRGLLPDSLCDMPELSYLKLSGNQISGPIPECIGNVTSLRRIDLASNRLSSTVPSSLWNLNDVLELDLSSNFFGGDLPREIQNLKVAVYINLSSNGFTSVVPDAFSKMQDLINFSLASNNLQGSIPKSLSKMISLVSLDLSNNSLSGEIPKELEELKYLTYFNVSFNELSGEIPSGGPFGNFGYLSFVSNEALCGATPQLRVPRCSSSSSHQKKVVIIVSVIVALLIIITCSVLVISWVMRRRRKPAPSEADQYYSSCQSREMERFTYHQLKHATNNFSDGNLLGSGGFSSVYLASFENGILFAVKVFNLEQERASKSFETECEMLSKLRHRNLTKVVSACSNLDFKALLLEYMRNGSLEDWLYCEGYSLDMLQRLNVVIDVASALDYLHHGYVKLVVHCDLKPSNVLLDGDMVGHVADFGITKLLGLGEEESIVHTQTLATMGYMAPEYGIGGVVSSACDVYSFGILLMETFTRKRPSDDMFVGELSLRSWTSAMLPHSVDQIVDSTLMRQEEKHSTEKMECVSSIFALALACTVESPKDRMNIKNVLTSLQKIKVCFLSALKLESGSAQG